MVRRAARSYSGVMPGRGIKSVAGLAIAAVVTWWLRLLAHSKKPPAEGHWRELDLRRDR